MYALVTACLVPRRAALKKYFIYFVAVVDIIVTVITLVIFPINFSLKKNLYNTVTHTYCTMLYVCPFLSVSVYCTCTVCIQYICSVSVYLLYWYTVYSTYCTLLYTVYMYIVYTVLSNYFFVLSYFVKKKNVYYQKN